MCWALNHQNIIEIAQRHISLSIYIHVQLEIRLIVCTNIFPILK
jgi:hypothetical protein